jgi:type II secretory pathway predicted ATPase ExeA
MGALKGHPAEVLLWLDEADPLPHRSLSELRGLAESNGGARPAFSVVLSGLPALRTILDAESLFPLKRRLDVCCVLEGLRRSELDAFLLHRFGTSAAARVGDGVRDELFERTRALPALLRKAVACALDLANDPITPIGEEHVHAALDALGL